MRAYSQARQWAETGGSAFEIKTGSNSQVAITWKGAGRHIPGFLGIPAVAP